MLYRQLGNTGLKVSQLGFGAMRLPMTGDGEEARVNRDLAIPMIHHAFEGGLTYIDTAVGYCNQDSQRAVGEALQGWRDKIVVSTKNPEYDDEKVWWQNLENSLERLRTDYIDVYNHHGIRWTRYTDQVLGKLDKLMFKAKEQGLIRHICASFHDTAENLVNVINTGYVEVITLQYNMLDRNLEDGIALAAEKGIGIVVMGPVAGGRLGSDSEVLSQLVPGIARVPELALRFVLSNPNVSVALSGMSTMQMVEENLATTSDRISLKPEDRVAIDQHLGRLGKLADLYCTGCGYCLPCTQSVTIPQIFAKYNEGRLYGLWDSSRRWYAGLGGDGRPQRAEACIECGECEAKCPQNIPIMDQLKEAHEALKPQ